MRVAIFFGYLCYLLLKGYGYLYADSRQDHSCHSLAYTITNTAQHLKFTNPNLVTFASEIEECLIDDDIVEDGGGNNLFARKYKLLTRHYLTRPCTLVLSDLHFKDRQSFYSLSSCRYVVQRALRI